MYRETAELYIDTLLIIYRIALAQECYVNVTIIKVCYNSYMYKKKIVPNKEKAIEKLLSYFYRKLGIKVYMGEGGETNEEKLSRLLSYYSDLIIDEDSSTRFSLRVAIDVVSKAIKLN